MLQHISIDTLIPYDRNNKIHDEAQIKKIAKSIKELWFRAPILIDENNIILAGHWRLAAAKKAERLSLNIELDPKYAEVILKRYKRITGKSVRCLSRDLELT